MFLFFVLERKSEKSDANILSALYLIELSIYGPFCDGGELRIPWNQELYDIYDDMDIVKRIKIQHLRWLAHVAHIDSPNPVRKDFESEPAGRSRRKERPRQRGAVQVTTDASTLGIRNWRQAAIAADIWRPNLAEATANRL